MCYCLPPPSSYVSGAYIKVFDFSCIFLLAAVEKESIEEREKREQSAREKDLQEEAERKLKEEKATGSLHDDGNTADQQPKTGVVEVRSL
jgi:hypothetical protein